MTAAPYAPFSDQAVASAHRAGGELAAFMPPLIVSARRLAAQLTHGVHGRKRAGAGDQFWQFRPYMSGESTASIDWRRSARDRHLYVREREWEGAHQLWLWVDRSATLRFKSSKSLPTKEERALVLALALADVLVRGSERVGLLGMTHALAHPQVIDHFASCFQAQSQSARDQNLPEVVAGGPHTHYVLISDFLAPFENSAARIAALAQQGARGHIVVISDPLEEIFPFHGHVEFQDVSGENRIRFGAADEVRARYIERLKTHRTALHRVCAAHGWTYVQHRTDRAPAHILLALFAQLADDAQGVQTQYVRGPEMAGDEMDFMSAVMAEIRHD
jgi:uncharacterized protein (DUF58 family)